MSRTQLFLALALSLSAASACDEAIDDGFGADDDIAFRPSGMVGVKLNTSAIGDHLLHELHRLGKMHEDVELTGVFVRRQKNKTFYWLKLDEVWVDDGKLRGRAGDQKFYPADFVGSRWEVNTWGGGVVKRWMTVHRYREDPVSGKHLYTFAYPMDPTYGQHAYGNGKDKPIPDTQLLAACGGTSGNIEAVLMENLHVDMKTGDVKEMEDLINIACVDAAIGKSNAEFGYDPLKIGYPEFQAVVRMTRADYCGDGDSWTKPGTPIDLEDKWGINTFFDPDFKTEALWTPKGAACVTLPRRPEFTEIDCGGWILKECGDVKLGALGDDVAWTKTPI